MSPPFVVAFVVGVTPGKWAGVWAERMPRHGLELRPMQPDAALAALLDGTADAAFVRLPVSHAALSVIPLYEEKPVVVLPKDHALADLDEVSLADLAAETALTGDWAEAIELVAANVGVVVVPQSVARALSRKDVVARPVTDAPTTQVALVWPTESATEATEEFIGIVRGRTANSSRGTPTPPTPPPTKSPVRARSAKKPKNPSKRPKRR